MIGPYFDGGIGFDLFAGSGGLGIEALSRGLDKVIFVDRDSKAIHTIRENIHSCGFDDQVEIFETMLKERLKHFQRENFCWIIFFLILHTKNNS